MKYICLKLGLIIILLIQCSHVLGQQYLWTTMKNDSSGISIISFEKVTSEVLAFYDHYRFYFDLTGYSKKRFLEEVDNDFGDWTWLYDVNELMVVALRSNAGRGSFIMVLSISEDNVNLILFSNDSLLHKNAQPTSPHDKNKFASWFRSLLN